MSILSRARAAIGRIFTRASPLTEVNWRGYGGATYSRFGRRVQFTETEQLRSNLGWVRTATHRISSDVSALEVSVEVKSRDGEWKRDDTHPLARLLAKPNDNENGPTVRFALQQHGLLTGRMCLMVTDGTRGEPADLEVIPPPNCVPERTPGTRDMQFRVTLDTGKTVVLRPFDTRPDALGVTLLESKVPHPDPMQSLWRGNGALAGAGWSVELHNEIQAYSTYFFRNNAVPGAVAESPDAYPGKDKADAQRDDFNEKFQGVINAGKVGFLWGGLKLRVLAPEFKSLDYPALNNATRDDILGHFGTPASLFGVKAAGNLGGNASENETKIYQQFTLESHRLRLQAMLNALAARFGDNVRVVIETAVAEDRKALETRWLREYQSGILSRLEYRERLGYHDDKIDGYVLPRNLVFVEKLEALPAPPAQPPTPALPAPQEDAARVWQDRFRAAFAGEYRRVRDTSLERRDVLIRDLDVEWKRLHPDLAPVAARMRAYALENGATLVDAYEALKSGGARELARSAVELEART